MAVAALSLRPEQVHYDTIEQWIRDRVSRGDEILFNPVLFEDALRSLWERFDVPFEVRCLRTDGRRCIYLPMSLIRLGISPCYPFSETFI